MSRKLYRIRAEARRDLDGHIDYLLTEADDIIAARFIAAARASFAAIAQSPGMGVAVQPNNSRLTGMRKWRVKGFPKFLIFYQTSPDAIHIVRILHSAQDWWVLLEIN